MRSFPVIGAVGDVMDSTPMGVCMKDMGLKSAPVARRYVRVPRSASTAGFNRSDTTAFKRSPCHCPRRL